MIRAFLPLHVFETGPEPPLCNSVWRLLVGGGFAMCPKSFLSTSKNSAPMGRGMDPFPNPPLDPPTHPPTIPLKRSPVFPSLYYANTIGVDKRRQGDDI